MAGFDNYDNKDGATRADFRACEGDERRGYGAAKGAKKSPPKDVKPTPLEQVKGVFKDS
jgi:hypothetical protein